MLFQRLHVIGGNGSFHIEMLPKWRLLALAAVHCDLVAKQPLRAGLCPDVDPVLQKVAIKPIYRNIG